MTADVLIVLTNCPSAEVADRIARTLVEQRLVACANRLAPVASTYRWQGRIESADEHPLLLKTVRERYTDVEAAIRALHPYEVPEILCWSADGWPPYLRWVADESQPPLLA